MKTILDCLEKTEMEYGDKTAVTDGHQSLTWHELKVLAQRAGSLLAGYTKPGSPIPLLMEKSPGMLAAMLGSVYAGCFYIPICPSLPVERVKQILDTADAKIVVTTEENKSLLAKSGYAGIILLLEELLDGDVDTETLCAIRNSVSEKAPLYCIFTSGSTGTPKGILVSQKAVIQFIGHFTEIFHITEKERIGNQAPFDFDVSVKDIYSAITTGATLVLIPKELFSTPPRLLDYLCEMEVTTIIWAASALCIISMMRGFEYRVPEQIRKVMFSGEAMPVKQLHSWQTALPQAVFINLYGPTEITCNCTYYVIDREFRDDEKIPIGRPFPGRTVFLADKEGMEISACGESGEICVAGESISEGYYNNPEETAKRFGVHGKERMYRTGDLGTYGEDGNLYFCGRTDFQIKHMGHRIELEEVERTLVSVPGVDKGCCVFDRAKNRIVGFYVGDQESVQIRRAMKRRLPSYMIPNKLVRKESIPLTKNGKMDRTRLMKGMVR